LVASQTFRGKRRALVTGDERLRVALVAHEIHDGGGMERAFAELLRRTTSDVDFTVFASVLQVDLRPLVRWIRVPGPRRPALGRFASFWAGSARAMRGLDVDLVHTLGAITPRRADLATVPFCHAAYVEVPAGAPGGRSRLRAVNEAAYRRVVLQAERRRYRPSRVRLLAPVSPGVERELRRFYPTVPTHLTPNGVDLERFRPDDAVRADVRLRAAVHDDEIVALFVGGDWVRKGLRAAIDGVAAARRNGAAVRLWVVGRGDAKAELDHAHRLGIGENVTFFPPEGTVERFFQAADVFVLPTAYETFSLVAYEAAACGLPIVATMVSGIEDLIGDGACGIPVVAEADAIAGALCRLAADGELRASMGTAGRERAAGYDWGASARSVLSAYERLLG
jgi:glycosyltransferase involved in cell wall biosynthesis